MCLLCAVAIACTDGRGGTRQDGFEREEASTVAASPTRCARVEELASVSRRGLFGSRSPEIIAIPKSPNFIGGESTLVHSGPWDYLIDTPLVMYGPGHIAPTGPVEAQATMADVAPTLARLAGYKSYDAPDGKPLMHAIESKDPPRLIVTIVWDGGGWNVLDQHAGRWPFLEKLSAGGVSYVDFTVGSSPSVTPAIHTSLGTGAFPSSHGIVGLRMRTSDLRYVNPLGGVRPGNIEVLSLADLYDRRFGNEPVTGMLGSTSWHIGMIGKGASIDGGDKDPVVLMSHNEAELKTNTAIYSLPKIGSAAALDGYIGRADAMDGKRDGKWFGRSLDTLKEAWLTPALVDYTEFLLRRMVKAERFGRDRVTDLLFVNFKSLDLAGHAYSYRSKEVGMVVEASDEALRRFVRFLDGTIGEGRWVVAVTADHGQTPYPQDSGALPIRGGELADDIVRRFDNDGDSVRLVDRVGASGIYIHRDQLATNGVTLGQIARWVSDYRVGENLKDGENIPAYYDGDAQDRIFDGVMVHRRLVVPDCS